MHLARLLVVLLSCVSTASLRAQWSTGDSIHFSEVFRVPGGYVNDHALIRAGTTWHLFYTGGIVAPRPWYDPGNETMIGHVTSNDLSSWTMRPPALALDSSREFRRAHLYAPAVVAHDDRYYMFYTVNLRGYGAGEEIRLAVSDDLDAWRPIESAAFRPDRSWAEYTPSGEWPISCRDPFVIRMDSIWVMYYVARLRPDSAVFGGLEQACVAAATSDDLLHWIDRGPVLTRSVRGDDANRWAHPESPCIVVKDRRTYLFWKGGNGTRYVISNDPFDFEGNEEHILATSHASRVFEADGRWLVTSCSREIGDVLHARSDRTRGLYIAPLDWSGMLPVVGEVRVAEE
jgi:arabinan endo-1,5-alpha-L-arabinosidase